MEATPKSSTRSRHTAGDSFLFDAVKTRPRHLSLGDGFRFGAGLMLAVLLFTLIIGGIALAIATKLPLN
jgi:hypothetical protein